MVSKELLLRTSSRNLQDAFDATLLTSSWNLPDALDTMLSASPQLELAKRPGCYVVKDILSEFEDGSEPMLHTSSWHLHDTHDATLLMSSYKTGKALLMPSW